MGHNGTVTCWGDNGSGQSVAPAGRFTAVTAGWWHSCGLRVNGTVTCWGDDQYGQNSVPRGRFTALSASGYHSCGIRADGTLECWGGALTVSPPRGVRYV